VLPRFAAVLAWLAGQGAAVERFNLAQQPEAFASNETVRAALATYGTECLPLILVDGASASRGTYPTRQDLVRLVGLTTHSLYTPAVAELVAIGAALASHCEPCLKYHIDRARKLGVSVEDMALAVETARTVKETPARAMLDLADRLLRHETTPKALPVVQSTCCAPETAGAAAGAGGCCA
jgi:AhpD family alkylhydroperoxidase